MSCGAANHGSFAGLNGWSRGVTKEADEALWRDWAEIWQSEFAALAQDPEAHESWAVTMQLWQALAAPFLDGVRPRDGAGAGAAAGAAAACDASGAGESELAQLERRVAALERRLDEFSRPAAKRRSSRKPSPPAD